MLDSDVARLYGYETKRINETVNRNIKRFPEEFCFQLTEEEVLNLRLQIATSSKQEKTLMSQIATSKRSEESLMLQIATSKDPRGGRRKLPYAFTEQGIAMLSGLLKNEIAVEVSIQIMNAFVEMRRFIVNNNHLFERLTNIEYKLLEHDKKFDELFNELLIDVNFKQKIFFNGQIYDAYSLLLDIIMQANNEIIIIDNYINKSILDILAKKKDTVKVLIITRKSTCKLSNLDITKFNGQYPSLRVQYFNNHHDRFIIIDQTILYHVGASLKDLGKKTFGINKIDDENLIQKILS